jgi:hypothetical protein
MAPVSGSPDAHYTGSKERGFESHSCQKGFISLLDFFLLLGVLLLMVGAVIFLVLGELHAEAENTSDRRCS